MRVLALDRNADNRRDGELHSLDGVRFHIGFIRNRGVLLDELIQTDARDGVTSRNIINRILATAHAQNGSLDRLDVQIFLFTRNVVRAQDSDLLTSSDGTGEDTTKRQESTLICGRDHLGDVQHERTLGVARADTFTILVIKRTFVQSVRTVLLRGLRRRQVVDNHLKQRNVGRQPRLHDSLHERFAHQFQICRLQLVLDLQLFKHREQHVLVVVHGCINDTSNRLVAKLNEGSHASLSTRVLVRPLLFLRVKEVVAPKLTHHAILLDAKLRGVHLGEDGQRKRPVVQASGKANGTLLRGDGDITQGFVGVRRHDDVRVFDNSAIVLVRFFAIQHEFQKASVELIHRHYRFDTLTQRLSQHGFRLHANAFDAIDDDQGAIGNTQSGGNFGRKINVARGINQVDQVVVAISRDILRDARQIFVGNFIKQGDARRFDRDAPILLVLTSIRQTRITGIFLRDDTRSRDQRIRESGFALLVFALRDRDTDRELLREREKEKEKTREPFLSLMEEKKGAAAIG